MKPVFLTLLLASAAVLGTAVPTHAQDGPPLPKKGGKDRERGGIKMGGDDEPAPAPEPKTPDKGEIPAKSEPEELLEKLGTWPGTEAKRASIRLAAQPRIAYPLLEKKLLERDQDWRMIAGVAATLGKIGDLRALELIESKLQDRKLFQHSGPLLDALVRIDPVGAKARLVAALLHPASAVVIEARTRLEDRVAGVDVDALRDVYEAGGVTARDAAVILLAKADQDATRPDIVRALRDRSAQVCATAARTLAEDDSDEALQLIRRGTRSPVDRQLAYAYLALGLRNARSRDVLLEAEDVRTLLGGAGLQSLEQLNRAVAATVLGDAGYYHEMPKVDAVLEGQIVPALLEVCAGRQYWADLKVIRPLALQRLQRLTGQYGLRTDREWSAWWNRSRDGFRARRVLLHVPEGAISSLIVSIGGEGAGDGVTTFVVSASSLEARIPGEQSLLLTRAVARTLVVEINASGILAVPEGLTGDLRSSGPFTVRVRAGDRQRSVSFDPEGVDTAQRKLVARLLDLRRQFAWQRYRPTGSGLDLATWVEGTSGAFGEDRTSEQKAAALATLIVNALSEAHGETWLQRSLDELEALPHLATCLGDEETLALLRLLGGRDGMDTLAEGIVRVLARSGRDDAHPLILDFVIGHPSTSEYELFALVFQHASDEAVRRALRDERATIRTAALQSLRPDSLGGQVTDAVRPLLDDAVIDVQAEALRTLGRVRDEAARPLLEELAAEPGDLRVAALEALGLLGGKASLPTLMLAFADREPALRIAAIEAFASAGEPEGLSAIVLAMGGDPSPLVREVASRSILRVGTERAAAALRKLAIDPSQPVGPRARALRGMAELRGARASEDLRRLVTDEAEEVGDEAALALARRRDPACDDRPVGVLSTGRLPTRAPIARESVSRESFDQ